MFRVKSFQTVIMIITVAFFAISMAIGNTMEEKITSGDSVLILNGEGFRNAYGMKMYICGLYLIKKCSDSDGIINGDSPMAVKMIIYSSLITGKRLEKSTREGFMNSTGGNPGQLTSRINCFLSIVASDLKKGDVFLFVYDPQKGTQIVKNGVCKGIIDGLDFKKALFGIWLCDKPPSQELKRELLGK
jgi:hypothetical protein